MSDLFTIDCHACGAKNTIDTETMRRVDRDTTRSVDPLFFPSGHWIKLHPRAVAAPVSASCNVANCHSCRPAPVVHLGSPEPAGDSDWPEPAA